MDHWKELACLVARLLRRSISLPERGAKGFTDVGLRSAVTIFGIGHQTNGQIHDKSAPPVVTDVLFRVAMTLTLVILSNTNHKDFRW